jgi:hypothetical protein
MLTGTLLSPTQKFPKDSILKNSKCLNKLLFKRVIALLSECTLYVLVKRLFQLEKVKLKNKALCG